MILSYLLVDMECEPSIVANRGIESVLRRLFCGSNTHPNSTHVYVDYLDDPQVHIPRFRIPRQITHLTIVYHYRRWVPYKFRYVNPCACKCNQPAADQQITHLSIMGAMTVTIVRRLMTPISKWKRLASFITDAAFLETDIPVTLRDAFTWRSHNYPIQEFPGPEFARRVMFGERMSRSSLISRCYPIAGFYAHRRYISMFEQVIPLGSVGYIDPLTRKFIILFNAIDPVVSSTEPRIQCIPSLLTKGVTKLTADPGYSSSPAWDYEYETTDILCKLGAWTSGRSIRMGYDKKGVLYLVLGRAFSREIVGEHFGEWLHEHRKTITDVFGDDHPFIRKHLDLVTTTVDSSQYAWFVNLGHKPTENSTGKGTFYFEINPQASRNPGSPWGKIKVPKYYTHPSPVLISWDHVSIVGQSPMTVEIRCHFIE
ncbi:hypothetical protein IW262DRAFT_1343307 [Armillaria fumosa]|nr:hypothetical protein IW262DRAFT_1343307 [Armillaria fumosa]